MKANHLCLWVAVILLPLPGAGQVNSRAAEIQQAREAKLAELQPEVPSKAEDWMNRNLTRESIGTLGFTIAGFSPLIGGAAPRQGFAIGPQYLNRTLFDGNALLVANYQITTSASTRGEVTFALPKLAGGRVQADVSARRHNYNRIDYYGSGPDSEETGRSNYRYEDMAFDARVQFQLGRSFVVSPNLGGILVNVGPGKNEEVISTEQQYSPIGIDRQSDFFRTGVFAGFDWRENPGGSRTGGLYGIDYNYYDDLDLNLHDFHLMKVRAEQYIPFFNKRRVFALRGQTIFTWASDGQSVPFYFQPVLGGSDDLRGYRAYRFYGNNSLLLNAEYRWEVFSGMNAVIFADVGKVANRRRNLDLKNLESSVGVGLRFNIRNVTFLRFDVGFSHEGYQIWLTFDDVFLKKAAGRSSPEHVF